MVISYGSTAQEMEPDIEVEEQPGAIVVRMELGEFKPNEIQVVASGSTLIITAPLQEGSGSPGAADSATFHDHKREFWRAISLPAEVDSGDATTVSSGRTLTITFNKLKHVQ